MTNGEKIKQIFPNGVLTSINNSYYWGDDILVSKNWWNAEYKEPTTKNDLGVDKPAIIDWNNCHTSEQLDSIATTKNDLGVDDCVSRGMTREQAIRLLTTKRAQPSTDYQMAEVYTMAIKALEREPTTKDDLGVREFEEIVVEYPSEDLCIYPEYKGKPYFSIKYKEGDDYIIGYGTYNPQVFSRYLRDYFMSSVTPQEPKIGHCKDCKYFEYDSVANVDGMPLIVAHEICKRWGNGCKTKEDGYCFMFEPQENEVEDGNN